MKKLVIGLVLVFFIVGTSCFAQSNNDVQRIVGIWKNSKNDTFTFNQNGTFLITRGDGVAGGINGKYFISGSVIVLNAIIDGRNTEVMFWNYFLSANGSSLVLVINRGRDVYFTGNYWLEK